VKQDWETRTVPKGEIRAIPSGGDSPTKLECRAIVYNSWSTDLGGFRERMLPGSAELSDDLVGLFDHDTAHVLGRVSAGTMEATRDNAGVSMVTYPPDTQWARDMLVSIERGDIGGCSYRMKVPKGGDHWYVQDGQVCRDIRKARISELTITSMPAYVETTAEVRSHLAAFQMPLGHDNTRDTVFGTTLANSDADRMASWMRFYQLESALETTITDALAAGDQGAAAAAFSDFTTSGAEWLAEHIARFGAMYPISDDDSAGSAVWEVYSRLRGDVLRTGRVLSVANETLLNAAVDAIETASESIEKVLAQVDPNWVDDDEPDDDDSPDAEGGAPDASTRSTGGAPDKGEVYVPRFGFTRKAR